MRGVESRKSKSNFLSKNGTQRSTRNELAGDSSSLSNLFSKPKPRNVGTKLTGAGSRRNKSIFTIKSVKRRKKRHKKKRLQRTSNIYAQVGPDGQIYFYIPTSKVDKHSYGAEDMTSHGEIISLSARITKQGANGPGGNLSLTANFTSIERQSDFSSLENWVPLDGIFGIYHIPSGPHLVIIVDSEEVYRAPPTDHNRNTSHFLQIHRIKSMEIVPIPIYGVDGQIQSRKYEDEQRQFQLLRRSLKEHEFYFTPRTNLPFSNENAVISDITHTLQRSFTFWYDHKLQRSKMGQSSVTEDSDKISKVYNDESQKDVLMNSASVAKLGSNTNVTSWWKPLVMDCVDVQRPDSRFFWNEYASAPLLEAARKSDSPKPFLALLDNTIPVTSAFVGVERNISIFPNSTSDARKNIYYDQILISRRSKYRAGTRFTKRGADGIGDVANFAETEQICLLIDDSDEYNNATLKVYSHVQTRGSIPIRWSSPTDIKTYRPKVMIGTDPLAQARALRNHLFEQLSLYTNPNSIKPKERVQLDFVNLIDKHSDQGRLGRTFDSVLDAVLSAYTLKDKFLIPGLSSPSNIKHTWFDFHAECKSGRWDRLGNLLKETRKILDDQGYFCAVSDIDGWKVVALQDGIVRTNCMDCLDRTNVVQSMFGRYILYQQLYHQLGLSHLNSNAGTSRNLPLEIAIAFKRNMLVLPWSLGEEKHRLLWADNADEISRLYAGTPALKGDFTRTGKRTRRGAFDDGMNSLQRFYLNNFMDADRQEGMDLLTGYYNFDFMDTEMADINVNGEESTRRRITRNLIQREKIAKELEIDSRLDLLWLPGDLQSHLRSAAALSAINSEANLFSKKSSTISLSSALHDIDRRSKNDSPWWALPEINNSDSIILDKQIISVQKPSSGHMLGVIIAITRAPIYTALACIGIILVLMGDSSEER